MLHSRELQVLRCLARERERERESSSLQENQFENRSATDCFREVSSANRTVLDSLIGGSYVFRKFAQSDGYPTCSHIVAKAYGMVGKTFGNNPPAAIQPDCIHDFVKDNPQIYEKIRELKLIPKRRNE